MNVVHVLPFPGVGGTEVATLRVMNAVAAHGARNRALLLSPTPELRQFFSDAGIAVTEAASTPQPSLRHGLGFLRDARRLAAQLRSLQASLVHCADILSAYHVAAVCRAAAIPVICQVRNRYSQLPPKERLFVSAARHFLFVSRQTWKEFAIQVPPARGSVIYDGIDIPSLDEAGSQAAAVQVRRELGLPPDAIVAGMFARVAPQKDYETLIRAAAILAPEHPRLVFLIVGDYQTTPENRTHYAHLRTLLEQAGLTSRFVFAGFRKDAQRLMTACDLCLLSTNWEGLPLVLLEAMAVGRPVIATNVDGIPEIVLPGVTGQLYPHGDAAALAGHLRTLLSNPVEARRLGESSREHVRRHFSRERFGQELFALYQRFARPC